MPPRRTHIEQSACVCIVWLLKRSVPSKIINVMVVRDSLLNCAVVVVVAVVIVVVIKSSPVG